MIGYPCASSLRFPLSDVSRCARDGEKRMSRHARVKREEAKQGLSLHDVRMNGLTIRGVIRTGDAERIDCPAPMLAAMLFGAVGII